LLNIFREMGKVIVLMRNQEKERKCLTQGDKMRLLLLCGWGTAFSWLS
jgi:hypothetical protein